MKGDGGPGLVRFGLCGLSDNRRSISTGRDRLARFEANDFFVQLIDELLEGAEFQFPRVAATGRIAASSGVAPRRYAAEFAVSLRIVDTFSWSNQ